jgi:hypothetical protein
MVLVAHRKSTACIGAALESYCRERERERGREGGAEHCEEWRLLRCAGGKVLYILGL